MDWKNYKFCTNINSAIFYNNSIVDPYQAIIILIMENNDVIKFCPQYIQGLEYASDLELEDFEIIDGSILYWKTMNVMIAVDDIIEYKLGSEAYIDDLYTKKIQERMLERGHSVYNSGSFNDQSKIEFGLLVVLSLIICMINPQLFSSPFFDILMLLMYSSFGMSWYFRVEIEKSVKNIINLDIATYYSSSENDIYYQS